MCENLSCLKSVLPRFWIALTRYITAKAQILVNKDSMIGPNNIHSVGSTLRQYMSLTYQLY